MSSPPLQRVRQSKSRLASQFDKWRDFHRTLRNCHEIHPIGVRKCLMFPVTAEEIPLQSALILERKVA
ncbi:hypothetical protein Y032_0001g204 [Ancylostoma ceylanicum]|uniref:Uncharacterized protein n=1 Tax=Ancylostoma ceylanicum TaxID=53326 RepID=A0A016W332_9BILA|nr:hypothetical protein Y032_0001g204 [Ancylostoma ceylanicum]